MGNSPGPVNSPHKGPVTRKIFPFDDVIMIREYLENTIETPVFDILIWWKWLGTNHKQTLWLECNSGVYCLGKKIILQCPKLKIDNRMYRNVSFVKTLSKISHDFQGIDHYIVNLWEYHVCSIVRNWYHTKFTSDRRITSWALIQNGETVWVKMQYLGIWYPVIKMASFE